MKLTISVALVWLPAFVFGQSALSVFTNPLLEKGPDPWVTFKDGYYYYTHTMGDRIEIWKTENIGNLKRAEHKTVWFPPKEGPYSKQLWAPEIHLIQDKWYVYVAADDGSNINHRLWVLECQSNDPMRGEWIVKGKLEDPGDHWAIDGSVFKHKKQLYIIWSGWEGNENGRQNIYISKLKNPWTMTGRRVMLSTPTYDWETHGKVTWKEEGLTHVYVNEGPQILEHGSRLFIIYSASACWTDNYALGMMYISTDGNLMDPEAWTKSKTPVFQQSLENEVYAPGHNSFFTSPDGTENWILYHANSSADQGCGNKRSPRAQKFRWTDEGMPDFGVPVKTGIPLTIPSANN